MASAAREMLPALVPAEKKKGGDNKKQLPERLLQDTARGLSWDMVFC